MGAVKNAMVRDADANAWDNAYGDVNDQIGDILTAEPKAAKPRRTMYDLPSLYAGLISRIEDAGGEITDEIEAELAAIDATLESKTEAILALAADADRDAAGFAVQIERMTVRKRVAANRSERLRDLLKTTMLALGRNKVKGETFEASVQKNGVPTIRATVEVERLPIEFVRTTLALDGKAAQAAHRSGTLPDGLFEVTYGTSLKVR